MDTRKGYKMLITVLFFAFISLISRSIIYLVLSVTIATMIIFLLSSNKKAKKMQAGKQNKDNSKESNKKLNITLWATTIIGVLALGYGLLLFTTDTIFHQILPMPEEFFIAIIFIIVGFSVFLSSLYFLLRQSLTVNTTKAKQLSVKTDAVCSHCGDQNNRNHAYCSNCGQQLP